MKTFLSILLSLILLASSSTFTTQVYDDNWSISEAAILTKASGQKSRQGFAIYGNYLLQGYNQGQINIYNISGLNQNQTSIGTQSRVGTFTIEKYKDDGYGMHVNNMSFSSQTLSGSAFPLLYITGGDSATYNSDGSVKKKGVRYDFCVVENIVKNANGTYSSQTVQTIQLSKTDFKNLFFYTWFVDGDYLYTFSTKYRTNGSKRDYDADNRCVVTKFKRPDVSSSYVELTASDVIEQKEFPYTTEYTQGGAFYDGNVFYCYGDGSTEFPNTICAYNFDTGKEILEVNLGTSTTEIEACCVQNGILYFNTQDGSTLGGKLYALSLNDSGASRYYGNTRYETCLSVDNLYQEKTGTDSFSSVVLASGANFPDALSGSYLAICKDAPIVLIDDYSSDKIVAYLKSHLAADGTIYLLGGNDSISPSVKQKLVEAFHQYPNVHFELISGENRLETNLDILKACGVSGSNLMVCSANSFADALSVASLGTPILLVNNDTGHLTEDQKTFLNSISPNALYFIGGTSVISDDLKAEVESAVHMTGERVAGWNRYATNQEVLNRFDFGSSNLLLASGNNFPDALSAGPLAYYLNAPILLTQQGNSVADSIKNTYSDAQVYAIGGQGTSDNLQLTDSAVQSIKPGKILEYLYEADLQRK